MRNKRIWKSIIASLLICSMITPTVYATPSSQELKEEQEAVESEVNSLQAELESALARIEELEGQIETKGQEIEQAGIEFEQAVADEEEQYAAMKVRIQYMYEQSSSTATMESILQSQSISDMLNKFEYVNSVYDYDRNMLDEYIAVKEKVVEKQITLEEELVELEELEVECAAQKESLAATIANKEDEIAALDIEIQQAIEAEEEEARRRAEAEEAARRAAEEAAQREEAAAGNNSSGGTEAPKPSTSISSKSAVVNAAAKYIGVPYKWGGSSFSGIDCSGLTQAAYAAVGISIPRTSSSQRSAGATVGYSIADASPGDILCYSGHVAIYAGNGQMIHAPRTGYNVELTKARTSGLMKVVRF